MREDSTSEWVMDFPQPWVGQGQDQYVPQIWSYIVTAIFKTKLLQIVDDHTLKICVLIILVALTTSSVSAPDEL